MGRGGHFFVAGELGVKFFLCVRLRVRCPSHPPIAQVVAIDERATAGVFVASGRGQSRAYTVRQLSLPQPPKGSTGNGKNCMSLSTSTRSLRWSQAFVCMTETHRERSELIVTSHSHEALKTLHNKIAISKRFLKSIQNPKENQ